jgi:hypothetical protein
VATVLFKAAQFIAVPDQNFFMLIGRYLIYGMATSTTIICLAQLLGLAIVSYQWYVGWA